MTKKKTEQQKAIDKFKGAFKKKFGDKAEFDYTHRIEVSVPLSAMAWDDIEPAVKKMLTQAGLDENFEIGGAGTGFGMRDISIYAKDS